MTSHVQHNGIGPIYHAENAVAKLKYPCENKTTPYALILEKTSEPMRELWDMNMLRPDVRCNEKLMHHLINNSVNVVVLYKYITIQGDTKQNTASNLCVHNLPSSDVLKIPVYIYWDGFDDYSCKNIRKVQPYKK